MEKIVAFIVPFKPKRNSRNWTLDSSYLKNTLLSILSQTCNSYHIFVSIHEMPENPIFHEKIDYIEIPFSYCNKNEIEDLQEQLDGNSYWTAKDVEYLFDQGRKQMYAAKVAKQRGFKYIMSIDADDLVSNKLVSYVNENKTKNLAGWYVDKGYYYLTEKNVFLKQPYSMNLLNGSTYVIHRNLIPDTEIDLTVKSTNFFSNHPYLITRLLDYYGVKLQPVPFYAIVYVVSNLNWWTTIKKIRDQTIRQRIKYIIRRVVFKRKLFLDFSIEKK